MNANQINEAAVEILKLFGKALDEKFAALKEAKANLDRSLENNGNGNFVELAAGNIEAVRKADISIEAYRAALLAFDQDTAISEAIDIIQKEAVEGAGRSTAQRLSR